MMLVRSRKRAGSRLLGGVLAQRGRGFLPCSPPADYTLVTHRDVFAGQAASRKAEWTVARALVGREPTRRGCLLDHDFAPKAALPVNPRPDHSNRIGSPANTERRQRP
jgi:hypothetical protein